MEKKPTPASASSAQTYPVGVIAKLLMLTERRVQQLVEEGFIPKAARGKYDLVASVQGYVRHLREIAERPSSGGGATGGSGPDYYEERARLTKERADQLEIKNAMLRGEIVLISDATALLAAEESEVRAGIEAAEPEMIAQLANVARSHGEVARIIRAAHQKAFVPFTQDGPNPAPIKTSSIPPDLLEDDPVDVEEELP